MQNLGVSKTNKKNKKKYKIQKDLEESIINGDRNKNIEMQGKIKCYNC